MIRNFYLLLVAFLFVQSTWAQEKLLYSTEFNSTETQPWKALSPTKVDSTTFIMKTNFSGENLKFKLFQVFIAPTGKDATRFYYGPGDGVAGIQVTPGWAIAQKVAGSYIELSPLKSITKVTWIHGATGSNRGYRLWKKNATDADWVDVYNKPASPANGEEVTVNINEENVALKFTNIAETQNAYMFNLSIYGNYTPIQYSLTTDVNIPEGGIVTKTPNSVKYDKDAVVSLEATPNPGYEFVKWVNGSDADLSTDNPYPVTIASNQTIKAIFQIIPKKPQTITFNAIPAKSTSSLDFDVDAIASSALPVTLSSSNTAVAAIVHGKIQIRGAGATDITASQAGNGSFFAAPSVTHKLTVVDGLKLPANNFRLIASDAGCVSSNNGSIKISAIENLAYTAKITTNKSTQEYSFTQTLEVPSLRPGNYNICITVDGHSDYIQCFDATISEPKPLTVYSMVNSGNKVSLSLSGSSSYTILLNGNTFQTEASSITLDLLDGMNKLSVSTEKECQGVVERDLFVSEAHKIYPNPFDQTLFVNLGNDISPTAQITVASLNGSIVYTGVSEVQSHLVQVNLSDLTSGMYVIKIKTGQSESSSKIFKQ